MRLHVRNLTRLRKSFVGVGFACLLVAAVLFVGSLVGLFAIDSLAVFGQSGLRTLAGIAVAGCLLAAIGYWDE